MKHKSKRWCFRNIDLQTMFRFFIHHLQQSPLSYFIGVIRSLDCISTSDATNNSDDKTYEEMDWSDYVRLPYSLTNHFSNLMQHKALSFDSNRSKFHIFSYVGISYLNTRKQAILFFFEHHSNRFTLMAKICLRADGSVNFLPDVKLWKLWEPRYSHATSLANCSTSAKR